VTVDLRVFTTGHGGGNGLSMVAIGWSMHFCKCLFVEFRVVLGLGIVFGYLGILYGLRKAN